MLNSFQNFGIILATVAAAVAFLLLLRRVWHSELRRPHNDLIGWHLSVLGSTYAVIIGFMLFAVWTNFETAEANAEAEANCLVSMVRSSRGLAAGPHEQIRGLASEYVDIMLHKEWPAMERGEVSPESHVSIGTMDGRNRQRDTWRPGANKPRPYVQRARQDDRVPPFASVTSELVLA